MKRIDSDALVFINRILGIPGGGAAPGAGTELDDQNLSMVLNITDALRRGRAGGVDDGYFFGLFLTVHTGAGVETATIDPYAPAALVPTVSPYPAEVPAGLDLWVIGATGGRTAGAGDLVGGFLGVDTIARHLGWGVDEGGAAVSQLPLFPIARFASLDTAITGFATFLDGQGNFWHPIMMRIPRGQSLSFKSQADAAATFRCIITLGLFPEGLGQDLAT